MRRTPPRPAAMLCAMAVALSACAQINHLPKLDAVDLRFRPAQSSRIFASDGRLVTTLHGVENRTVVPLSSIPKFLQHAVVAIEDERFYEHSGVDVRAIVRAAVADAASGTIQQGGSTITQQYVKNVIIAPGETADQTIQRKINEAALARQIERRLTKKQILARYLNTVYFGNGAYGVQAAARAYFGVSASKLTLADSALIAAVIRSPESYDPIDRPRAALARRNLVLRKMVQFGWAKRSHVDAIRRRGLHLRPSRNREHYPAAYFIDYVRREIKFDERFRALGRTPPQRESQLFNGGLRIYTTVDLKDQAAAENAARQVLPYRSDPYAAVVSVSPRTGHIKAMVGGRNYFAAERKDKFAKLNLAITGEPGLDSQVNGGHSAGTGRQAGSAFKPFALAAGIEHGISLSKTYQAAPCMDFPGADNGGTWHVCNYEGESFGGALSLLEATVHSVNVVFAQLILALGPQPVVDLARKMGIRTPLQPVNSAVLGANPVNALDMASAYSTFATGGMHHPPVAITKIVDSSGKVIYRDDSKPRRVLAPSTSYIATTALEQVIQRGTGVGANIGRPAAGKTGTAQEYRDAWFVGYTPDLATAVWVGYPSGEIEMKPSCLGATGPCRATRTATSGGVTGGSWPASIWRLFMLSALSDVPAHPFTVPTAGVVTVAIDTRNGCLAGRFTPAQFRSYATFVQGTQPTQECREPGDAVKVPDVFSFPVDEALKVLRRAGFNVQRKEEGSSAYPPGRVIDVAPKAGTVVPTGSTVTITVSTKPAKKSTVPDVLGRSRAQAVDLLRSAGFEVKAVTQAESDPGQAKKHKGLVWKQDPGAGTAAPEHSTVTIWVNPD